MHTDDFDYPLPRELVAQTPVEPRDSSRLLVMDRARGTLAHHTFHDLPDLLHKDDLLVFNDSRVLPACLHGRRAGTGGWAELLLLRREEPGLWQCLGKPAKGLRPGVSVKFDHGLEARVVEAGDDGVRWVRFNDETLVDQVGHVPIPPYIHTLLNDPQRYQTVYAGDSRGSVAAPTAGLHFTPELMERVASRGVELAYLTLYIGLDTFRPVEEADPMDHKLHTEFWDLPSPTAQARGQKSGVQPGSGWADLFILPGHRFGVVDALVTNFHLPRSTLLMLVSAFAGRERVLDAYREAVLEEYRFYSFGDCMIIL